MLLKVLVCMYQGNVYTREIYTNYTTVYMDSEIAAFNNMEEANAFIDTNYPNGYDSSYDVGNYHD